MSENKPTPESTCPSALPFMITDQEMKDLMRFHECVTDGEGYDVPKERMKQLAEIGLLRRVTSDFYEHTTFGLSVINGDFQSADEIRKQRDELRLTETNLRQQIAHLNDEIAGDKSTIKFVVKRRDELQTKADAMAETINAIAGLCTYQHESKEDFIGRVRAVLGDDPDLRVSSVGKERDDLLAQLKQVEALSEVRLSALEGLHKICEIALSGKDGQQHTYFETRAGHFVEATAAMQAAEAAIAGAPDNLHSFSLRFDREEWGHVIDGLILERERSMQRKQANPESNSNNIADRCAELIDKIAKAAEIKSAKGCAA